MSTLGASKLRREDCGFGFRRVSHPRKTREETMKVRDAAIQSLIRSYHEFLLSQASAQLSYTYLTNPDSSTIGLICHSLLAASYRADYGLNLIVEKEDSVDNIVERGPRRARTEVFSQAFTPR
jgi:hypothetical protein